MDIGMSKEKFTNEFGINTETLIKGGGCAFPFSIEIDDKKSMAYSHGMTLRDYFAAKALLAGWAANMTPAYDNETRAKYAYQLADAMLKAREL
jgi:hypothetical protein